MSIPEFLKDYGGHVIALVALSQLWVLKLWSKWIDKGTISFYPVQRPAVSFGAIGPSVTVQGTLRAFRRDVFITSIGLHVRRSKDGSSRALKWFAFQPPTLTLGGDTTATLEFPAPFLVIPATPHAFRIVFYDEEAAHTIGVPLTA
jgi:hypothetical protein